VKIQADYGKLPNAKEIIAKYPKVKIERETKTAFIVSGVEADVVQMLFELKKYSLKQGAPIHSSFVDSL
jgi:hypothetical protein